MRWHVENTDQYVTVRTEGAFTVEDHRAMVRDIISQPFWTPGTAVFFDNRACDFGEAGYEVMKAAVENHRSADEQIGAARSAILMNNLASYGTGRIFDGVSTNQIQADVRIFTDEEEARRWLIEPGG